MPPGITLDEWIIRAISPQTGSEFILLAGAFSAELGAFTEEQRGRREAVRRKRLERIPDVVVNKMLPGWMRCCS